MAAFLRYTLLSCLASLLLAQTSVDQGEEPFSSKIVRKTLDNGTIVEYEYLYYYDTEDGEEESVDFEDGLSDEELLPNPSLFTSPTPAVQPVEFTTPTPPSPAPTSPSGPISFTNPGPIPTLFPKSPSVTPSRLRPSSPRLPNRPSSSSPVTPQIFRNQSPFSPIRSSASARFTNPPPTSNIPTHSSVRPSPFPSSFPSIPARSTFNHVRGQTDFAGSPNPNVNTFAPVTPPSPEIAEIVNNEVTNKPVKHGTHLNRHRNRHRPRVSSNSNRSPVTPKFVTERPLPIPTVHSNAAHGRLRTNTATSAGNTGHNRFFGSRQRGQSIRPSEPTPGVTPVEVKSPSITDKPTTEKSEDRRNSSNISTSRNRFRTNSARPATRRRPQSPKPVSVASTGVNSLPAAEKTPSSAVTVAPPRRRGSSRFRTGSANRLTNSISLNSPIVEQNLALGPRRTARRRPIASNPTVFGRGNAASSARASRVIGGGARRQHITTETTPTTTSTQPRLPQGTRFPPRAASSELPLTGPTVAPHSERVAVSEAGLAGDNLYSLSRVVEPDFQTEQPILSTTNFDEEMTTDDELQWTTDYSALYVSSTEKAASKLKKFSNLRPRPNTIVPLKALPALSTPADPSETSTNSYSTYSPWPQSQSEENEVTTVQTTEQPNEREETTVTVSLNKVKQTTAPAETTTSTTTQAPSLIREQNSRQTSAIRRPIRLRGSRRRPNRPPVKEQKNALDNQITSIKDTSINSIGERQSPFRRTPSRRRPSPTTRVRNPNAERETISDSDNEIDISNDKKNKVAPVEESPSVSTFRRAQTNRRRTGGRFRGRPSSRRGQSESPSVETNAIEDEKSILVKNDIQTEEVNNLSDSVKAEEEEQTAPSRTRHRHNFRNRRPFSSSGGIHRSRANVKAHQELKQKLPEEEIAREEDTIPVESAQSDEQEEAIENEDEEEIEDDDKSAIIETNKSPLAGRRRRPFRGRERLPSNQVAANKVEKQSKPNVPNSSTDDDEKQTFRSRFSRGRFRGRNNVRPRGFLPPTEATEKQIEEVTELLEATTITTTPKIIEDTEKEEEEEEKDDIQESDKVDEQKEKHGLRGLSHRRRPSISRFNQRNRPEKTTKLDQEQSTTQETPAVDEDPEPADDSDDDEEDAPVVDGERPLRFNTARNAPSVRDSSRNFVSVGRGLFGGSRRPSQFHRTPLRHSGGLRGQLTEKKITNLPSEKNEADDPSIDTPTTLTTVATTTTTEATTTEAQRSFRLPFSGVPRKGLNERRRKFVPGGFRRPPTFGFQALRRNKLSQNSAPEEKLIKTETTFIEEDNEGSGDMVTVEMMEDVTTTTEAVETTTKRSRLKGRRRGGRQTQLSLSEQLRILNN